MIASNHLNVFQVGAEVWHCFVSQRQLALQRLCDPSILDGKSIGYLTPKAPNRFLVQPRDSIRRICSNEIYTGFLPHLLLERLMMLKI